MQLTASDYENYCRVRKLRGEFAAEEEHSLIPVCWFILENSDENATEKLKFILTEKATKISDSFLIELCNDCLLYNNEKALGILLKEVVRRNSKVHYGSEILFCKGKRK